MYKLLDEAQEIPPTRRGYRQKNFLEEEEEE
jgi:hypothetical protein